MTIPQRCDAAQFAFAQHTYLRAYTVTLYQCGTKRGRLAASTSEASALLMEVSLTFPRVKSTPLPETRLSTSAGDRGSYIQRPFIFSSPVYRLELGMFDRLRY